MPSPEHKIISAISALADLGRPAVVALDGGSGSGKSTIADKISRRLDTGVVHLDDFYQTKIAEAQLPSLTPAEKQAIVWDWERVRTDVLEPLRASKPARWHAFDFTAGLTEAGTYRPNAVMTELPPAPVVILDGAYSTSPQLIDLIDLTVLVDVPTAVRHARVLARDDPDFLAKWHPIWDDVETYYFTHLRPPASFDLVIHN